ncbi:MAG: YceI family protein [Myxococcales bacterium]|nr:YceI family protein [Myxococcales bacterium]
MPKFEPRNSELSILTFREGLLSSIAHDLLLRPTRFWIDVRDDKSAVSVWVDAASIRVVCAMKDGVEAHHLLNARDKTKIEETIHKTVLETSRYPDIRFESTSISGNGPYTVAGTLKLHGFSQAATAIVLHADGKFAGEATVHQPDYGITPYSAMMGTLKVAPNVRIRVQIPEGPIA